MAQYDENGNLIEDTELPPIEGPDAEVLANEAPPALVQMWREWRADVAKKFKNPAKGGAQQGADSKKAGSAPAEGAAPAADTGEYVEEFQPAYTQGEDALTTALNGLLKTAEGRRIGVNAEQADLSGAMNTQRATMAQQLGLMGQIKDYVLARYHISNGNFDIDALRGDAEAFIKKPQVSDTALKDYKAKGPAQMGMPEIPDKDRRLLSKIIMSTFASVSKSIAQGAMGGQRGAIGGMTVDPGTKILAEEGRMLSADAQRYTEKVDQTRNINFMLEKEWGDNVTKMQADLDNRLDAAQNAYDRMISATIENRMAQGERLLLGVQEKIGEVKARGGAAIAGLRGQEELTNVGLRQNTKQFNAEQYNKKQFDIQQIKLAIMKGQESKKQYGYDIMGKAVDVATRMRTIAPDMAADVNKVSDVVLAKSDSLIRKGYGHLTAAAANYGIEQEKSLNTHIKAMNGGAGPTPEQGVNILRNLAGIIKSDLPVYVNADNAGAFIEMAAKTYQRTGGEIATQKGKPGVVSRVNVDFANQYRKQLLESGLYVQQGDAIVPKNDDMADMYVLGSAYTYGQLSGILDGAVRATIPNDKSTALSRTDASMLQQAK